MTASISTPDEGILSVFNVYPLVSGQTKFFACTRLSDVAGPNVIVVGGGQGGAELIRAEPRRREQHATCCITLDISHHRL